MKYSGKYFSVPATQNRLNIALMVLLTGACLVTVVALSRPLIAIAVVYALVFWLVALKRPTIALLLIFATAPFQNDLSGDATAKFSIAEINLYLFIVLLALLTVAHKRPLTLGPLSVPTGIYLAVSALAALFHWRGMSTVLSLVQMFQYLVLVVLVFASGAPRLREMPSVLNGLLWACVVLAVVGTFVGVRSGSSYFWGLHKNGVGASLACGLVIAGDRWLGETRSRPQTILLVMMGIITTGLVFTLSRGAWMSALIGLVYVATVRRQLFRLGRVTVTLVPLFVASWFLLPSSSQEYALGFDSRRQNIADRYKSIDFARDQFLASPVLGNGIGLRKQYDATNLFWLTLAETGVVGLVVLLLLHIGVFQMLNKTRRFVAIEDTRYSLLTISGGLVLGKAVHGMVDHYWSRGDTMITWAAVGMALGVHFAVQHERDLRRTTLQNRDMQWEQIEGAVLPRPVYLGDKQ